MKTTRHSFFPSLNFSSLFSHLPLSSLFLTSLTFLFATAAQAQVPSYVPTNGLVGYWPFNGNANDESGNGNNGTVNGATLTADRFGNIDEAYDFNADAQIVCPQNNIPTQGFSLSVWLFQENSFDNMEYVCLGSASSAIWGAIASNNNCYVAYGAGCSGVGTVVLNSLSMEIGNWIHLTYVSSGVGGTTQIYKNGVYAGQSINSTSTGGCSSQFLYFGVDIFSFAEYIDGKLDDIGMWNRALTADEVLALYNGCNLTAQVVAGNITPGAFANSIYTCNNNAGSTYTWTVNNGVIVSGQGTNSVTVLWGAEGVGSVSVLETTADGCVGDEVIYDVNVQCVVSGNTITGPVGPEAFSNSTYTCNGAVNSTYNWAVTNGVIASGQGTNIVNILWASTGLGNVSVVETTAEGCVGTTLSQDVVVIPTNVEELSNVMLLYPNPATTELNLQITSDLIGTDLFVFDALGKQILKQQILSTNTIINTSSFALGNYLVKVGGGVKKFEVVR